MPACPRVIESTETRIDRYDRPPVAVDQKGQANILCGPGEMNLIGQTVSHYIVLEKPPTSSREMDRDMSQIENRARWRQVREGGVGVVYKAEDTSLSRIVTINFPEGERYGIRGQPARQSSWRAPSDHEEHHQPTTLKG